MDQESGIPPGTDGASGGSTEPEECSGRPLRRTIAVAKEYLGGGGGGVYACAGVGPLVASAGEAGCVLWDIRQPASTAAVHFDSGLFGCSGEEEPLNSVAFAPSATGNKSGAQLQDVPPQTLCVAHGRQVSLLDLRRPGVVVAGSGSVAADDINQIVVHEKGDYVACADDAGDVVLLTYPGLRLHKRMARAHENLCTAVQFRPRRPWEMVSGGMDGTVCQWNFSKTRYVSQYDLSESICR